MEMGTGQGRPVGVSRGSEEREERGKAGVGVGVVSRREWDSEGMGGRGAGRIPGIGSERPERFVGDGEALYGWRAFAVAVVRKDGL